jgi:uncharacterized membrane protein YidH (DUF202 family)
MVMGESHISTDVSNENAAKQVHEAIEMTRMGWIRASLALIGFGFALGEAFHLVRNGGWRLKRFKQGSLTTYEKPWYLSMLVAVLLMIIGLIALVAMALP